METLVARPDGVVEAGASTQWPGRPQGEPLALEPVSAALFTPEQMKRLDEWTEEAPLIHPNGAGGSREGFETYIERSWRTCWRRRSWCWQHNNARWRRLERRAVGLILRALPEGAKEEMVATKSMTCYAILCKLMASYQPGGLVEKGVILQNLENRWLA